MSDAELTNMARWVLAAGCAMHALIVLWALGRMDDE